MLELGGGPAIEEDSRHFVCSRWIALVLDPGSAVLVAGCVLRSQPLKE